MDSWRIRPAAPGDVADIARLIAGLAEYEKLSSECRTDENLLREHLFGEKSYAEVLMAEMDGLAVGMALFFHNYSTFLSKPGIHLEDLFVDPEHRGKGIGKALLQRLTEIAADRGCARVEWMVLDWNEPAIEFYKGAFGAEIVGDWRLCRLTEERMSERREI